MFTPAVFRRVSQIVIVTFTSLTLQPLQAAVMAERQKAPLGSASPVQPPKTEAEKRAERLSAALGDMDNLLREIGPQARTVPPPAPKKGQPAPGKQPPAATEIVLKPQPGVDVEAHVKQLRAKHQEIAALEDQAELDFAETDKHLKDARLPQVILDRQTAAVAEFRKRRAEFDRLMTEVADADDNDKPALPARLKALNDFMEQHPNHKVLRPADPNKLPFGKDSGKVRPPKQTGREYRATLFKPEPVMLAGPIPSGFTLPATTLPYPPTAADLAPTEDVVLTPAIKAQAAALNSNPVQIYNWVRNSIEFLPTYGSIQGADMTLQTKRGNDIDTASLLIALFRAAGIPARYVYGTIEVPAARAMNWVGGVTVPEAALQLMGQGGIPSQGMFSAGRIASIQLEHVWVEAYVDYTPSRGAINKHPDTWVVMDPSFKQYAYTQGMNIAANVPFSAQSAVNAAQTGATIDPSGWVQNLNASAVQSALTAYQTQVQNYLAASAPNATVGDVIGTKTIIQENHPIMLGTLPYRIVATGAELTSIPFGLRHTLSLNLYADAMSQAAGMPMMSYSPSLPSIAGKKVALVYQPARSADQAVITAAIANNQTTLPAYLIQVLPVLKVEGIAVATGQPVTMGTSQIFTVDVTTPAYTHSHDYSVTAGDLCVLGINAAGINKALFDSRIAQHNLSSGADPDYTAEMFYQVILGYWGENYAYNGVIGPLKNVAAVQLPSHGMASAPLSLSYFFGIPTSATYKTRALDIQEDRVAAVHRANDPGILRSFMLTHGQVASYLEAGIYDQAFSFQPFAVQPVSSMSSVTVLKAANDLGIPIYTIDQTNAPVALPQLAVNADAMTDIQNAIAAGKRVTAPQRNITVGTFAGTGYIIEDTTTGSGAYMISGGRNGGSSGAPAAAVPFQQPPRALVLGSVMGALEADVVAAVAAELLEVLALLISPVGLAALAIVIIILVLITTMVMLMEDFRDEVISRAATNPLAQQLPPDNCTLSYLPQSKYAGAVVGWNRCIYTCRIMAARQFIIRYLPTELGCPSPVPCVPGLLWPTGPRVPGVTPIDPSVAICTFTP